MEIVDERLHVAEDGRVARQVDDEPVGELHHEADRRAVLELCAVGFQQVLLGLREQRGDFYFREVALLLDGSDVPVEFGANKVSLLLFPPKARQLILEERLPLGTILKECGIAHGTVAKAYFQVLADQLISSVLGVNSGSTLYGRKATINDSQKRPLSEVVEILPL